MEHHAGRVITVGAGVGEYSEFERSQAAVGRGPQGDVDRHWMPYRSDGEFIRAGKFVLHRAAGFEYGEGDEVFGEQLLFTAETTADPGGEYPHGGRVETKEATDLFLHQKRYLRAGAEHQATAVEPAHRGVGFEVGMCNALGLPAARDNGGRFGEAGFNITVFAVQFGDEVAGRVGQS